MATHHQVRRSREDGGHEPRGTSQTRSSSCANSSADQRPPGSVPSTVLADCSAIATIVDELRKLHPDYHHLLTRIEAGERIPHPASAELANESSHMNRRTRHAIRGRDPGGELLISSPPCRHRAQ